MSADQTMMDERIERLRRRIPKDRRPSVADLIAAAQISRSRWYRIMAGEGHFSVPEATRLAAALEISIGQLIETDATGQWEPDPAPAESDGTEAGRELEDFFGSVERIIRRLSNETGSDKIDPVSKIALLNGIEEAARLAGQKLPPEFWKLRQQVVEGG